MKDVQCYELFGGISRKNHVFSFFHSTTSLLQGCAHCDNRCWCCLPVEFLLRELIGNGEKLRGVSMGRSRESESVILVIPLQFNEGFFVLSQIASFTPRSNSFPLCPRWLHH